jgi:hypothetical protein
MVNARSPRAAKSSTRKRMIVREVSPGANSIVSDSEM